MNNKTILTQADEALHLRPNTRKLTWYYALIVAGLNGLVLLAQYAAEAMLPANGGLSTMDLRAALETAQMVINLAVSVILPYLAYGQQSVTLRTAQGRYVDKTNLWDGLRRFGPLLRLGIMQGVLLFVAFYAALNAASILYFYFFPGGPEAMETLMLFAYDSSATMDMDQATALLVSMWPLYAMAIVGALVVYFPVSYRLRMAQWIILDGENRAFRAMLQSNRMMRRNCWQLFRLDLWQWEYILLSALASLVSFGDVILGLDISWAYWAFSAGGILLQALVIGAFLARFNTRYAFFYLNNRPDEPPLS